MTELVILLPSSFPPLFVSWFVIVVGAWEVVEVEHGKSVVVTLVVVVSLLVLWMLVD